MRNADNRFNYRYLSIALAGLTCATASAGVAWGAGSQIGLEDLLRNWRARHGAIAGLSNEEAGRLSRDKSAAWLAERRDLKITGTYEQSLRKVEDTPPDRTWSAGISRRLVAFPSASDVEAAFEKEVRADSLETALNKRGIEQMIARTYGTLLASQRLVTHLERIESELRPHIAAAERAARLGGLSHLAFRRWQLFQQALLSQKEMASAKLQSSRDFLVQSGAAASQDLTGELRPIIFDPTVASATMLSIDVLTAQARRDAALSQVRVAGDRREVELSLEFKRSLVTPEERSIQAGIGIPLDGGLVRASAGKEAEANLRLATIKAAIQEEAGRHELQELIGRRGLVSKNIEIVGRRVLRTKDLYTESLAGFRKGQIDFAEVVESLKEYHEASTEQLALEAEQDELVMLLLSLTNRGPFALVEGTHG